MKIYDKNSKFKRFALRRKDFKVEEKIDGGIVKRQLSFSYPLVDGRIYCEETIEYEDEIYRVKESPAKGLFGSVVASQDTDQLSGHAIQDFTDTGKNVVQFVAKALSDTGWTCTNVSASTSDTRNISINNTDTMKALEEIATVFWVEMAFSTKERTVRLYSKVGNANSRAKFISGFNLKSLEVKADTRDFCTRIYPIGKDGLTIADVNNGVTYLDNNQYSSDVRAVVWEDTNYTDAAKLKSDAGKKLAELSAPKTTYAAEILDVANISGNYEEYAFSLGDEADIIDGDLDVHTRERIVHITRYPDRPEKNTVELSNRTMGFSDMQKKLLAAADAVGNITNGNIVISSKVPGVGDPDISIKTVTFSENSSYEIASGESTETLFGKIKKLISTIKSSAPNFLSSGRVPIADKLQTTRYLDGVGFNGTANISHYATCTTSGGTAAKVCSITGFSLVTGARVIVRFSYANTAANPTLNVSSTGAKAIYYKGSAIPVNYIKQYTVLELVYNGSYWYVVGDLTQYLVDTLVSPTELYTSTTGIYASATQTWACTTVSGLSAWKEVRLWVEVGDATCGYVTVNTTKNTAHVNGYFSAAYNGTMRVIADFANNRVGVYVAGVTGWALSQLRVLRVEGLVKA